MTQKPVKEIRSGLVKASIFEREVEGSKGIFTSQSVALQTSFQDKEGNWQNRNITIVKKNIAHTIEVLQKALEFCYAS